MTSSLMSTLGVVDPLARDNFVKLNQVFGQGAFKNISGTFAQAALANMDKPAVVLPLYYARTGNIICLASSGASVASKIGTGNPTLLAPLPGYLWPVTPTYNPYFYLNNSVYNVGVAYISAVGVMSFRPMLGVSWTAATETLIQPFSITYVGS